ncbi:MAG TPA: PIN domain-containing protein [Aquificales bacterium]|nr:PIN domain-containing protein [Aquificales bacterium]
MKIEGKKIFVDTSAFLLFLHGKTNDLTREIFHLAAEGRCSLITTSRCVDELLFKEMVIIAKTKYGFGNKAVQKLRRNPEIVKELGKILEEKILPFLEYYRIEILPVKVEWVLEIPKLMEEFGLFGNDALVVRAMQSRNLVYLLSADSDFVRVNFIKLLNPSS